jgi:hypothetical protein
MSTRSVSLLRTRWAAIGAAVAVTLGFGAIGRASATVANGERNVFVPITPCRLLDTRSAARVGPRGVPILAEEEFRAQVWGPNGECNIPAGARAIVMNVTAVGPTSAGFLTVWPSDVGKPNASNLNFPAGVVIPNQVTTKIGGDGGVKFYTTAASTDLIADIAGYYEDHNHDDRYLTSIPPTAATTTTSAAATTTTVATTTTTTVPTTIIQNTYIQNTTINQGTNVQGKTVYFATADQGSALANGTTLKSTLATANLAQPAVVYLAPGTFDIGNSTLTIGDHVALVGSGQAVTTITSSVTLSVPMVLMSGTSEISNLTMTGGGPSAGIRSDAGTSILIHDITFSFTDRMGAVFNVGTAAVSIDHVKSRTPLGTDNRAGQMRITNSEMDVVTNDGPGALIVQHSTLTPQAGQPGVYALAGAGTGYVRLDDVDFNGSIGMQDQLNGVIRVSNSRFFGVTPREVSLGTVRCVNSVRGDYMTPITANCG